MSSLRVENVGQINNINGANVPDAFEVTLEILELVTESRQVFSGIGDDGPVVGSIKSVDGALTSDIGKTANNMASNVTKLFG